MNYFPLSAVPVYLLKVILISGLLYAYYRLLLRDRHFHQYNRYYLLGMTLLSLLLPLIPLPAGYPFPLLTHSPALSDAIRTIVPANWNEPSGATGPTGTSQPGVNSLELMSGIYLLAVGLLLYTFFRQLRYIRRLPAKYPRENMGPIAFFMTREPGTPFSFLNRLFWNEDIDRNSERGRQIFRHEWYHIRQRHTIDLLLLKPLLALFWVNPFFYLIYREIRTIHEFLADRHAVAGGDRYEYAELLVWHSIHDRSLSILHPFFQSSIKRRITMLTQFTSGKPGYGSRLLVLPLAFLLLCAFAGKMRSAVTPAAPAFTVVIDAGHGGIDDGAVAGDVKEKDLNLALALKVRQLSSEYHINVVLTRQSDELSGGKTTTHESLEYRTEMAKENKADLFVSLHVNNSGGRTPAHGFSAFVSAANAHYAQSTQLGSALIDALKECYAVDNDLKQVPQHIYVLRETAMPAVLLECGNIDNPADLAFIRDAGNRETIARHILLGIQHFEEAQAAGK